jgi:alpha-glucuronidase
MSNWGALLDPMVQFYKQEYERVDNWLRVIQKTHRQLLKDFNALRQQYYHLEEYAQEQETRANELRDIMEAYVNRHSTAVQRDLMEEFNEVANGLGVHDLDLSFNDSEFSIESLSDSDL